MLWRFVIYTGLLVASQGPGAMGQCELAERFADDPGANDLFGSHVAIDGDYAVVSAQFNDDASPGTESCQSGSAYVVYRDAGAWTQVAKLTASDAACGDVFGHDVGISGDWVLVGASGDDHAGGSDAGAAYVLQRDPAGWNNMTETQKLTAGDA